MLLIAKTRVAPVKKMTISRLELCGALLLAELTNALLQSININIQSVNLWSDSIITLHWIGSDPARWLTFQSLDSDSDGTGGAELSNVLDVESTVMTGDNYCRQHFAGQVALSNILQISDMVYYYLYRFSPAYQL